MGPRRGAYPGWGQRDYTVPEKGEASIRMGRTAEGPGITGRMQALPWGCRTEGGDYLRPQNK